MYHMEDTNYNSGPTEDILIIVQAQLNSGGVSGDDSLFYSWKVPNLFDRYQRFARDVVSEICSGCGGF